MEEKLFNEIFTNVVLWATKLDGFDGAIGGILENLPCPYEFPEESAKCEEYTNAMDLAIDTAPDFDVKAIVLGDSKELERLHVFAKYKATVIIEAHNKQVAKSGKER